MTKQRKGKQSTSNDKPALRPSDTQSKGTQNPLIEISEEEQWRLINESGVLKNVPRPSQAAAAEEGSADEESISFGEEILNTIVYAIPFSFLLLMMEILIHYQYHRRPTFEEVSDRMLSGVPILSILIFYTLRYKSHRVLQIVLFAVGILSGCRLIYQINHANWLTNMKQCPPLATIWIYTIFMSDLGPAVLALLTTASFVWWKDLKIIL